MELITFPLSSNHETDQDECNIVKTEGILLQNSRNQQQYCAASTMVGNLNSLLLRNVDGDAVFELTADHSGDTGISKALNISIMYPRAPLRPTQW